MSRIIQPTVSAARWAYSGFGAVGMRQRQQFQQLRVVVQHLLEMRHQPDLVGGIAGEAAAEVVVDAALRHPLQHQVQRVAARRCPLRNASCHRKR